MGFLPDRWCLVLLVVACALLPASLSASAYDYPLKNPYAATIIGTPVELKAKLPNKVREKDLVLPPLPGRKIPRLFWYQQGFRYSLAYQKQKAPLIFVIAGTGASYKSPKVQALKRAFYQAGFHVVCLTSPTIENFIVTASSSGMPGNIQEDSADLYRVMARIYDRIQRRVEVSEFYLTGYSLGGAQAAFISKLDEQQQVFSFRKVLMINPPLNLYNSVGVLDKMLEENIPGGLDNFSDFFNKVITRFSEVYKESDWLIFNNNFLFRVYEKNNPTEANMKAVIGTSFRASAANMVFTADVVNNAGYILPRNLQLSATDSTTDYLKVAFHTSFRNYFDELFTPFFQRREPGLTRQELIRRLSLASIETYLAKTGKVGMFHNADDPILTPDELLYLSRVLGPRAGIYPIRRSLR
ncbi:MAG: alpha/beta hydrolase [Syntrophotaleaceae bacterium]